MLFEGSCLKSHIVKVKVKVKLGKNYEGHSKRPQNGLNVI